MNDSSKDFIDLNPYLKLISFGFSRMKSIIRKYLWLILLLTVLIVVGKFVLDLKKPTLYKNVVTIKSDQLSFDVLRNSLEAVCSNLNVSNEPITVVEQGDTIKIYDVVYEMNVSYHDSVVLRSSTTENRRFEDLTYDYSHDVEIVSTNDSPIVIDGFLQFLNNQEYIKHERTKIIEAKKNSSVELRKQISIIDSTLIHLLNDKSSEQLEYNGQNINVGDQWESLSELLKFKNELIEKRLSIENDLSFLRKQEVFTVSSSLKPIKMKSSDLYNVFSWVLALMLSLFIVLVVSFLRGL